MAPLITIEDYEARQAEIRGRLTEIDRESAGQALADDVRTEWNTLNEELDTNETILGELHARAARLAELADTPSAREAGTSFRVNRPETRTDIWDMAAIRAESRSHEDELQRLHDYAMRAVEASPAVHPTADRAVCAAHIERLLEMDAGTGELARRILATGSPTYRRAFGKALAGAPLTTEEQRALSLTTTAGGYAVPFTLDPTVMPTSNHSVNPFRAIARIETITNDVWRGVTSAGVTAAYAAEGTEASDNAPSFGQPELRPVRAQAFIPYSIEIDQDWGSLQTEMARLFQDAKDDLEAVKFTVGAGSASNEPQGVLTGVGTAYKVTTAGTAALAVGDVYNLEAGLPPRYRPRASIVGNRTIFNRIRQFDTAGGASLWVDNLRIGLNTAPAQGGTLGSSLLGYGAYEDTAMGSVLTSGSTVLLIGDFNRYLIVDRIGMNVEVIPHLFGSANRFPTGQRGLYAFWRNTGGVLDANAFRYLATL